MLVTTWFESSFSKFISMCNKYLLSLYSISGSVWGARDAELNLIPFWFPRSSLGIAERRQLATLPCGQLCSDRETYKVLVEMGDDGQWLPGNGYFVLYKRSESEWINQLSTYCVSCMFMVCVCLHTLVSKIIHVALKIIVKEIGDKDHILKH